MSRVVHHDEWGREERPPALHDLPVPPRRLAPGDPGYRRLGPALSVLLDGAEVQRCVAYDLDQGTITRQRRDEANRIFIDRETRKIAVETVSGGVEVKWK